MARWRLSSTFPILTFDRDFLTKISFQNSDFFETIYLDIFIQDCFNCNMRHFQNFYPLYKSFNTLLKVAIKRDSRRVSRTKENCVGCPKTRNSTLVIGMTSLFCSSNEKGREKGLLYNTTTTTAPTVVAFPASRLDSEAGNDGNGTLRLAGNQLCPRPEATGNRTFAPHCLSKYNKKMYFAMYFTSS